MRLSACGVLWYILRSIQNRCVDAYMQIGMLCNTGNGVNIVGIRHRLSRFPDVHPVHSFMLHIMQFPNALELRTVRAEPFHKFLIKSFAMLLVIIRSKNGNGMAGELLSVHHTLPQ